LDGEDSFEEERVIFLSAFRRLESAQTGGPTPLADVMATDELRVFHASVTSKGVFRDVWIPKYGQKNEQTLKRAREELTRFLARHPEISELQEMTELKDRLATL
jgi:hypothetical protein